MANICDLNNEKAKIDYPTFWGYKLIIENSQDADKISKSIVGDREYKLEISKQSKEGKYKSYNLTVLVKTEQERLEIFSALKKECKFVL